MYGVKGIKITKCRNMTMRNFFGGVGSWGRWMEVAEVGR
jgi:hypothetical protein